MLLAAPAAKFRGGLLEAATRLAAALHRGHGMYL
jgi:hypothetical protein